MSALLEQFQRLPYAVQERIAHEIDWDYDSYEDSRADCIDRVLNGSQYISQEAQIERYMERISREQLLEFAQASRESLVRQLAALDQFIANP